MAIHSGQVGPVPQWHATVVVKLRLPQIQTRFEAIKAVTDGMDRIEDGYVFVEDFVMEVLEKKEIG